MKRLLPLLLALALGAAIGAFATGGLYLHGGIVYHLAPEADALRRMLAGCEGHLRPGDTVSSELEQEWRRKIAAFDRGTTHYEGCEREHVRCFAVRLLDEADRLRTQDATQHYVTARQLAAAADEIATLRSEAEYWERLYAELRQDHADMMRTWMEETQVRNASTPVTDAS